MTVLITGGAGYLGSHDCVAIDNLHNSHREALRRVEQIAGKSVPLVVGDMRDQALAADTLDKYPSEFVVHFAGLKAAGESEAIPLDYHDANVGGTISLLQAMKGCDVKAFRFIDEVYPAAWRKFHHSSGVKRSQISPMASMSWSKVPAPMRPRWALSLRAARATLSLLCVARLSGMTPDPGSGAGVRTFPMDVSKAARCIAPEITPRDHTGCHDAVP